MSSIDDIISGVGGMQASSKRGRKKSKEREKDDQGTPTDPTKPGRRPRRIRLRLASDVTLTYRTDHLLGKGTFGEVFLAQFEETKEAVAVKRVTEVSDYHNRELDILSRLSHPNIVELKYSYTENYSKFSCQNLVMEYVPHTLANIVTAYTSRSKQVPGFFIKLYAYQSLRALAYMHGLNIAHRDVKPQNLLVNPETHEVKLCDFGCSKEISKGTSSTSYICSRYYRAPELICGNSNYTPAIDVWSIGCVIGEMQTGKALFVGDDSAQVMTAIARYIDLPTDRDITALNPALNGTKFPRVKHAVPNGLHPDQADPLLLDLLSKLLCYKPQERLSAIEACAHKYFDELRDPKTELPSKTLNLFNFYKSELGGRNYLYEQLVPEHYRERKRR